MRVLQGVGGAMMVPVGRLVVLADAPKSELLRVVAFLVWPALVAPVIAPLAGGAAHRVRELALDLPHQPPARRDCVRLSRGG